MEPPTTNIEASNRISHGARACPNSAGWPGGRWSLPAVAVHRQQVDLTPWRYVVPAADRESVEEESGADPSA